MAAAEVLIDMNKPRRCRKELSAHRASFANNAGVNQTLGHIATMRGKKEEALNSERPDWRLR